MAAKELINALQDISTNHENGAASHPCWLSINVSCLVAFPYM
jgi:hypothetical protein